MGTDTAPVMENLKLFRFHTKRYIFWISVTLSEIRRYVSTSVTGCCGFCEWAKMTICFMVLCIIPLNFRLIAEILTCHDFMDIGQMSYTLLAKKVVTPPLKTIKPMWIELLCFHLAEIGMIWTRDCSSTKSDTTLRRHSMQGQVGSLSSETTV